MVAASSVGPSETTVGSYRVALHQSHCPHHYGKCYCCSGRQQVRVGSGLQHVNAPLDFVLGGNMAVLRQLLIAGFHVSAIRPPTVPLKSSRRRITLSAGHTAADVEALVKTLPLQIKSKGLSPSFVPTPVRWLPSSLVQALKGRGLQDKLKNKVISHHEAANFRT